MVCKRNGALSKRDIAQHLPYLNFYSTGGAISQAQVLNNMMDAQAIPCVKMPTMEGLAKIRFPKSGRSKLAVALGDAGLLMHSKA